MTDRRGGAADGRAADPRAARGAAEGSAADGKAADGSRLARLGRRHGRCRIWAPLLPLALGCLAHVDHALASGLRAVPATVHTGSTQEARPADAAQRLEGVTDAELARVSDGRAVRIGPSAAGGSVIVLPLETYVSQVLAGEGEPRATEAATEALATVVRTYLIANQGRHRREGFDFCTTTHCQVPRRSTAATRLATAATAGLVLHYQGSAAEVFYSASCGGRSEAAADLWPKARLPYLLSLDDEVHAEDDPWTYERTLPEIQAALRLEGIEGGRLADVRVETRSASGRATQIRLVGLDPALVTGDRFRRAVGAAEVRSTAFAIEHDGNRVRFVGRGYGHGVGLCVVGAGRRAARGESALAILAHYFPGLTLAQLARVQ